MALARRRGGEGPMLARRDPPASDATRLRKLIICGATKKAKTTRATLQIDRQR